MQQPGTGRATWRGLAPAIREPSRRASIWQLADSARPFVLAGMGIHFSSGAAQPALVRAPRKEANGKTSRP